MSAYMEDNSSNEPSVAQETESETLETDNASAPESESSEPKELSLEEQLSALEGGEESKDGQATGAILDLANQLGIMRNGLPVEFENEAQIKEVLSKGFDYTQKTQELAEQRRQFQEESQSILKEAESKAMQMREEADQLKSKYEAEIVENQLIADVIEELKTTDPDIFEELVSRFNKRQRDYNAYQNHPAYKQLGDKFSEVEKRLNEISSTKTNEEYQGIKAEWETGLSEIQKEYGLKFKQLGIKPDYAQIQKHWASDVTGKMSPKQALFAVHGDQISKALEAKARLSQKKAKNSQLLDTGSAAAKQNASSDMQGVPLYNNMEYLEKLAAKHGA